MTDHCGQGGSLGKLTYSIKMHSRIKILRAAPNHMVFCTENTLLVFPKHMTATHYAAVLGHAHFLTHKRPGAFIYLINNGVVLLKPFRRYFLIFFHNLSCIFLQGRLIQHKSECSFHDFTSAFQVICTRSLKHSNKILLCFLDGISLTKEAKRKLLLAINRIITIPIALNMSNTILFLYHIIQANKKTFQSKSTNQSLFGQEQAIRQEYHPSFQNLRSSTKSKIIILIRIKSRHAIAVVIATVPVFARGPVA